MEAPRQKLIKERATVVATTTLGFVSAAASRPSVEDICKLYSRAFNPGLAQARKFDERSKSLVETGREEVGQTSGANLRGSPIDVVGDAAKFHRTLLR